MFFTFHHDKYSSLLLFSILCFFPHSFAHSILFRSNFIKAVSSSRSVYHYNAKSMVCRGVAWVFEDVRTIRNIFSKRQRRLQLGVSGGMLPQKILKFRVSEMPSPGFYAGHFQ